MTHYYFSRSSTENKSLGDFAVSSILDFWGTWSLNFNWIKLFSWFTASFRSWFCCLMSLISSRINSNCLVISSEIFDPSSNPLIFLFTRRSKNVFQQQTNLEIVLNSLKCFLIFWKIFWFWISNSSPLILLLFTPTFAIFVKINAASDFRCFLKLNLSSTVKA